MVPGWSTDVRMSRRSGRTTRMPAVLLSPRPAPSALPLAPLALPSADAASPWERLQPAARQAASATRAIPPRAALGTCSNVRAVTGCVLRLDAGSFGLGATVGGPAVREMTGVVVRALRVVRV